MGNARANYDRRNKRNGIIDVNKWFKPDHYTFAMWTTLILVAAVALIMYQHASHTNIIVSLLGGAATAQPPVGSTISADPLGAAGVGSRASGVWTPIGPSHGISVFAYNPSQTWQ